MQHTAHNRSPSHTRRQNKQRLLLTLLLAAGYMLAEVIGGLLTNSLALLADAAHMLSDVAALALSLFAIWLADRPSPPHRTFGYYRAEILAALANGSALVAISVFIFVEAYKRIWNPPEVLGAPMMAVAAGGLLVNLTGLLILRGGRDASLNVRGAWLHVLTDTLGSVGAIVAGLFVWLGWHWADPVVSVLIGLLVIYSAWHLVGESVSVLMESAPRGIDVEDVHAAIAEIPGVIGVHDLHIWTVTSGFDALSAHVVTQDVESHRSLLATIRSLVHDRFGIDHVTIQLEPEDFGERETLV